MIPIQVPLFNVTDMTVSFLRYQFRKSARRVLFLQLHHLKVTQESLNLRQQRDSLGRRPFLNSISGFKSPDSMSIRKWLFIFFIPQREKNREKQGNLFGTSNDFYFKHSTSMAG